MRTLQADRVREEYGEDQIYSVVWATEIIKVFMILGNCQYLAFCGKWTRNI